MTMTADFYRYKCCCWLCRSHLCYWRVWWGDSGKQLSRVWSDNRWHRSSTYSRQSLCSWDGPSNGTSLAGHGNKPI